MSKLDVNQQSSLLGRGNYKSCISYKIKIFCYIFWIKSQNITKGFLIKSEIVHKALNQASGGGGGGGAPDKITVKFGSPTM